jgi:hypothetical protein
VPPSSATPDISEQTILNCCMRGDTAQLERWGRQGVRVTSGDPLFLCVVHELPFDVLFGHRTARHRTAQQRGLYALEPRYTVRQRQ